MECFTAIQYNVVILLDALRPQEMAFMRSLDGMAWNRCRSSISIMDSWQVLLSVSYTQNSMGFYIMRGKNHSNSCQVKNEGTLAIRMTLSKCLGR